MKPCATLVELLRDRAQQQPNARAYTFLSDGQDEEITLTYGELYNRARALAVVLSDLRGERAILLYAPDLEYVVGFFGCLLAGVIAVPAYPPDVMRLARTVPRLQAIIADSGAPAVLTTGVIASMAGVIGNLAPELLSLRWVITDNLPTGAESDWKPPPLTSDSISFIQYTSGSTGTPRGVALTHGNLLHNEELIHLAFGTTPDSVGVGWLPLYHDMGLIGNVIQPLYTGFHIVLMSPMSFLKQPYLWLRAISKYRGTHSGGPNFAYDVCVRKVSDADIATLDLSAWRLAFNGAEAVRAETLERFARAFEPCGFRRNAFYPCYGLAEASLIVTCRPHDSVPAITKFGDVGLELGVAIVADGSDATARVGSGRVLGEQRVLIVDPQLHTVADSGKIGEIWVSGQSVSRRYWNAPEATEHALEARLASGDGPYLRTGDLGFFHQGELFVAGRLKDLIIVRGRNHYPQDIERTIEQAHPSVRMGSNAAFSIEEGGEERLVVAVEVDRRAGPDRRSPDVPAEILERRKSERRADLSDEGLSPVHPVAFDPQAILTAVRHAIVAAHDMQPHAIVLLTPGTVPKTSSGKVQRHACRAAFLEGTLESIGLHLASDIQHERLTPEEVFAAPLDERPERLQAYIRDSVAATLRVGANDVDVDLPANRLGLDSMMAIQLVHELERGLGVVLPSTTFLRDETLRDLGAKISEMLPRPQSGSLVPPPRMGPSKRSDLPALLGASERKRPSAGQQALWFLHRFSPESAAYNVACSVRLRGPLVVTTLREAFAIQLGRHPILRTTYGEDATGPIQKVAESTELDFELVDATEMSDAALAELVEARGQAPFYLDRDSVFRVRLYQLAPDDHVLQMIVHHIACDLWSLVVMFSELRVLYPAIRAGRGATAAALPGATYDDFVGWQHDYLSADPAAELDRQFWDDALRDAPKVLDLPLDRPRPAIQSDLGASQPLDIPDDLVARAQELGREEGTTLFVVLLSVFEVLLARYSGQRQFLLTTPVNGRSRAEFDRVVGYFVNPVVLQADFRDQPTFRELLEQARAEVLAALEHQHLPFSHVVERLRLPRDTSRNPLVQVMFVLDRPIAEQEQDTAMIVLGGQGQGTLADLALEAFPVRRRAVQFDLTLNLVHAGNRVTGMLDYSSAIFDEATARQMGEHFLMLLRSALEDPGARVDHLPLLTPSERQKLLCEWNAPVAKQHPVRTNAWVADRIDAQARRTPDAIALELEGERWTYAELTTRTNRIANSLRSKWGVGAETIVGVCLERSLELVASLLAVMKLGGVYVPLDPDLPGQRFDYMVRDSEAAVILTTRALADARRLNESVKVAFVDDPRLSAELGTLVPVPLVGESAVYAIYTSGSTGQPKAAINTHAGLLNRLDWMPDPCGLTAADTFVQKTPYSFDVSGWELFMPLMIGARLVVATPGGHRDPKYLVDLVHRSEITTIHFVPSMLGAFLDEVAVDESRCRTLKNVFCSGEAITRELQARCFEVLPACRLFNLYGPTEAAIEVSFWECLPGNEERAVPIGRPIRNTRLYVLDPSGSPCPVGVPGELHIAGVGVARGYLRRPALTAERFVPDPFDEPGARMYRTGDLSRWRSDGAIEYLGRLDHQVKVRGFRIELGEIESLLAAHPGVRDVVVVAREDSNGDKRLIAYVTQTNAEQTPVDDKVLTAHLQPQLPEYMLPSAFVVLDALPLNPSGKVDRNSLPAPNAPAATLDYVAPRSSVEEQLCAIFEYVLGVPRVGVHDDFFALGGHSLAATRLVAQVRNRMGLQLTIKEVFRTPTVAQLAARWVEHDEGRI